MDTQIDFSIYDRAGRLAAVAEAKKKPGITRLWATNWARNFLAHEPRTAPAYLLLVTPESVYLWNRPGESREKDPTYVFDTSLLFRAYFNRPGVDAKHISPQAFELLVGSWLQDVMRRAWPTTGDEAEPLAQSGFLDAIKDGRVENSSPS